MDVRAQRQNGPHGTTNSSKADTGPSPNNRLKQGVVRSTGEDWFRAGGTKTTTTTTGGGTPTRKTNGRFSLSPEQLDNELEDISGDEDDLQYSHRHEPNCRGRTLRFLETNPVQVALYVLVLLDAVVVIAEILLDLHAMRSQYREASSDLIEAMNFLKLVYSAELEDYKGDNIHYILETIRIKEPRVTVNNDSLKSGATASHVSRRHVIAVPQPSMTSSVIGQKFYFHNRTAQYALKSLHDKGFERDSRSGKYGVSQKIHPVDQTLASFYSGNGQGQKKTHENSMAMQSTLEKQEASEFLRSVIVTEDNRPIPDDRPKQSSPLKSSEPMKSKVNYFKDHSYADRLLKIAHIFHYIGVGILAFFVVQVSLKIFGMGLDFFKKKLEIFDAVIVITSFALDLVFIEGITGSQTEEAIALLIIFLLWRILRIVNGIMVTSKKRHEFRIQLLKRGRRRAQKKIEYLEDEKNWKEREIANLRNLCSDRGATDDEISLCRPRRRTIFQKMDTSFGLSTIASLSLGISMSMTGSGRAVIESLSATELGRPCSSSSSTSSIGRRRQSFQQLFPVGSMLGAPRTEAARRPSFVAILQQMSAQNRHLERPPSGGLGTSTSCKGKTHSDGQRSGTKSMDRVPEEQTEMKREEGDTRYTTGVRLDRNSSEKRRVEKEEDCHSGPRDNGEDASVPFVGDHVPDVVIHSVEVLSPSSTSKGSTTRETPIDGSTGVEEGALSFSPAGSEERVSLCNSDTPPPKTSSSLPQLSTHRPGGPPIRGFVRRRGNLSLGSLVGRVTRGSRASPGGCLIQDGREARWAQLGPSLTADALHLQQRNAKGVMRQQASSVDVYGSIPRSNPLGFPSAVECRAVGSHVENGGWGVAVGSPSDCNPNIDGAPPGSRKSSGFRGLAPRNTRRRLLQVGVAWSRSQELQPRRVHHEVLGLSKLATRRKSAHCVYSESIRPEEKGTFYL